MSTRSYGQYCGLARALDVVGNRWSLLIVRELLVGPARYGQLQAGLPGIATNLLAERLRELEEAGVVQRQLDTDSNGVAYALTPWGRELRGPVAALVNWSKPLMISGPSGDSFRTHWLVVALESLLQGKRTQSPTTISVEVDGTTFAVRVDKTGPRVTNVDVDGQPDTVFRAEPMVVLGLAAGLLTVEQATSAGDLRGDTDDLAAVFGPG
jgi:DNA-binding HxlR family transcriptional regulator